MNVLKILPPIPIILISLSYISYFFSDLQTYPFTYKPHLHSPPPQQTQLSNFASLTTVRQTLESIKYWIVVVIIGTISIILFLLFELDFFFYLKIYQNLISEYLRIWFLKRSAYGAYIKSECFFFIYIL